MLYILLINLNCGQTRRRMKDERSSVTDIFRKQIFDAMKVLRKDKEKRSEDKTIYSYYITQHNH